MTADAGVLRSGEQLREAEYVLAAWAAVVRPGIVTDAADPREHEDRNLLLAAQLLVAAARQRTGSVGAHYRADADSRGPRPRGARSLVAPARSTPPAGAHGHRPRRRVPSETKDFLMTAPVAAPTSSPASTLATTGPPHVRPRRRQPPRSPGPCPPPPWTPCCVPPCWRTHPYGDITSQTLIPADARATAVLAARVPGVLSGGEVFAAAMKLTDPDADVELLVADGAAFAAGTALARVNGNARAVLLAERVALNLVQRMSAIATKT